MKKILIIIKSMEVGGAEMDILRNFPRINDEEDFEVVSCIFGWKTPLATRLNKSNIKTLYFSPEKPKKLSLLQKFTLHIRRIYFIHYTIKTEQPDIVHCFLPEAYLMTAIVKMLNYNSKIRPSYIMSRLSLNYYMKKRVLLPWLEKVICHRLAGFSQFIGNSNAIVKQLISEGCKPQKTTLLYNGIDTDLYACDRKEEHFKDNEILMVSVGNLYTYKGYDDLIEACKILLQNNPQLGAWKLEIAGSDKENNFQRLKHKIHEVGLTNHITLLGHVNDVKSLLEKAHLFVHPSHTEGLPNALIEAMSMELPIVATNVGGIPELIENDVNGFLVEPNSPEELSSALLKSFKNRDLLYSMGKRSKNIVISKFKIERSVSKYKEIYNQQIKNNIVV